MSSFHVAASNAFLAGEESVKNEAERKMSLRTVAGDDRIVPGMYAGVPTIPSSSRKLFGLSLPDQSRGCARCRAHRFITFDGFQIAMQHVVIVGSANPSANLARDLNGLVLRQPANSSHSDESSSPLMNSIERKCAHQTRQCRKRGRRFCD